MNNSSDNSSDNKTPGFKGYAAKRFIIAAGLIILVVWAFSFGSKPPTQRKDQSHGDQTAQVQHPAEDTGHSTTHGGANAGHGTGGHDASAPQSLLQSAKTDTDPSHDTGGTPKDDPHTDQDTSHGSEDNRHSNTTDQKHQADKDASHGAGAGHQEPAADKDSHGMGMEQKYADLPTGAAFVEATIASIDYELNHRFWGWRPNDIINFTDNVNNFQLGVLEVTRRTVVSLAERISRTGTTDSFNPHLENSMNWLMVKATRYWFPAPESKYKESIAELEAYKEDLINGRGSFYTRTDNLIPLLSSYEDLLGSCDENLVKQYNEDGTKVSPFKADDYFYYSKGVASSMLKVLEAIHHDFIKTLDTRHATELLHHAIESCRQATALDPILITNGDLDGVLANHRANMAAPISHARFYISQLIKTLST